MENIKTCDLCLEQIIKSENFDNSDCRDVIKILKIPNSLGITVNKDARICPKCVSISHLTYNFKTSCLNNNDRLKTLIHSGGNKLILEEVIVKEIKSEIKYEEEKVCRFCLNYFEVNSLVEVNDVILSDVLEKCLPEMDMSIVEYPLICYICNELLEKLFNYVSQFENAGVLRNLDTKSGILINESMSTVSVENCDDNIDGLSKRKENYEDPEFKIKSEELDIDEDIKNFLDDNSILKEDETGAKSSTNIEEKKFLCHLCPFQVNRKYSLKMHYKIHEEAAEVNVFKCDKCPYVTKGKTCLIRHYTTHNTVSNEETNSVVSGLECSYETELKTCLLSQQQMQFKPETGKLHNCTECSFQSDCQNSLIRHEDNHKRESEFCEGEKVEAGTCDKCGFTTSIKRELEEHKRNHRHRKKESLGSTRNVKYSCNLCSYRTTFKYSLKLHYRTHQKLTETDFFKCPKCPYATKWKGSLVRHNMRWHEDVAKLPRYKCDECPFETIWSGVLVNHKMIHKDPAEIKMYKCGECSHETKRKSLLKEHEKIHARSRENSETGEQRRFACNECSYHTTRNSTLKRHSLIHMEPSEVNVYKCDYCPFVTKWKKNIMRHSLCHKNPSDLPKFKCKDCPFETIRKGTLIKHENIHARSRENSNKGEQSLSNPLKGQDLKAEPIRIKEKKVFVCDVCSYQTTTSSMLKRHSLKHLDPSEVNLFKCDYCPFATKWKRTLILHGVRHKNPSELPKFKCIDCPFETKHKRSLKNHEKIHARNSKNSKKVVQTLSKPLEEKIVKSEPANYSLCQKNPPEVPKFKCNDCPYETTTKSHLVSHILVHKELLEVDMYKCKVCPYQTKYKRCIQVHERRHVFEVFKCEECNYRTKFKSSYKRHIHYHKEMNQLKVGSIKSLKNVGQIKCNDQMLHSTSSEREVHKCTECSFQTIYKITLKMHYKKYHGKHLHEQEKKIKEEHEVQEHEDT